MVNIGLHFHIKSLRSQCNEILGVPHLMAVKMIIEQ